MGLDAVELPWYAMPKGDALTLAVQPRLASWNGHDDPDQMRLQAYLDAVEAQLAPRLEELKGTPLAVQLDVGLPREVDLLTQRDLDNYIQPLADRLARRSDCVLVSMWATKQHAEQSQIWVAPAEAHHRPAARAEYVVRTTRSWDGHAAQQEIADQLAGVEPVPEGVPVDLELSFVVGPGRNWRNLWKPTIDALEPLLGAEQPHRPWHPRDGRILRLGLHGCQDERLSHEVVIGIRPTPWVKSPADSPEADIPDMVAWFRERQLPLPPVPAQFEGRLQLVAPATWGTRSADPIGLYMFQLSERRLNEYDFVVSFGGHGVNSWAITICFAVPGLTLALQTLWGGIYQNEAKDREAVAAMFRAAADCLEVVAERNDVRQTLVVMSAFRGHNYVGWLDEYDAHQASPQDERGPFRSLPERLRQLLEP